MEIHMETRLANVGNILVYFHIPIISAFSGNKKAFFASSTGGLVTRVQEIPGSGPQDVLLGSGPDRGRSPVEWGDDLWGDDL